LKFKQKLVTNYFVYFSQTRNLDGVNKLYLLKAA